MPIRGSEMERRVGVPSLTPPSPPKEVGLGSPRDMPQASLSGLHSLGLGPHLLMFTFLSPQRCWTTPGLESFGAVLPQGTCTPGPGSLHSCRPHPSELFFHPCHLPITATHLSPMVLGPALGPVHTCPHPTSQMDYEPQTSLWHKNPNSWA